MIRQSRRPWSEPHHTMATALWRSADAAAWQQSLLAYSSAIKGKGKHGLEDVDRCDCCTGC